MSSQSKPALVANDLVVSMHYKLTVDDQVLDTSFEHEPIVFLQGHGNIIPGLEQEIYGLAVDERKEVFVRAADAYGEIDPEAITEVDRSEFPDDFPIEAGMEIELKNPAGEIVEARVVALSDERVKLDFNHPLAGKDLHFLIQITKLRHATEEELAHGHVHHMEGHDHSE